MSLLSRSTVDPRAGRRGGALPIVCLRKEIYPLLPEDADRHTRKERRRAKGRPGALAVPAAVVAPAPPGVTVSIGIPTRIIILRDGAPSVAAALYRQVKPELAAPRLSDSVGCAAYRYDSANALVRNRPLIRGGGTDCAYLVTD